VGQDIDEISDHIGACYVGPAEACWHMMEYQMHEEKPSVYCLPVHLKDKHNIHYDEKDDPEVLLDNEALQKTPLTEWFTANAALPGAKDVSYLDFLQKFIWEKKTRKWKSRSQCDEKSANCFHKFYHRGSRFTQIPMYFLCLFGMQGELLLPLTDFLFYTCLQIGSYIERKTSR
jgi:hypothetical protein